MEHKVDGLGQIGGERGQAIPLAYCHQIGPSGFFNMLPRTNDERALTGDLIRTTFGAVGKTFSETPRSEAEIAAYADAMTDMFEAYLLRLSGNI